MKLNEIYFCSHCSLVAPDFTISPHLQHLATSCNFFSALRLLAPDQDIIKIIGLDWFGSFGMSFCSANAALRLEMPMGLNAASALASV
jgi:hypothetical protein